MDRRGFLQAAGLGSIGLGFPTLATAAWAQSAEDSLNFHFLAVSTAGMVAGVDHVVVATGQGQFDGSQVSGGGTFTHVDNAPPGTPKPLIAAGTWRARQLVSWDLAGTYGNAAGGILEMRVDLLRELPSPATMPGTIRVVCNFISARGHPDG